MKPVFEIIPEAIFFQETNLICEISPDGFSFVFENEVDRKFHGLSVFHFSHSGEVSGELKTIFNEQPLLHKNYKKVFVVYSGDESALLPEELYKPGENELLLNTMYGDLGEGLVATDLITGKKIYNVYRMPAAVHHVMVEKFPLAAFSHHYSLLLKQYTAGDLFKVIFYKDSFIILLLKGDELQIIQTYPYKASADVIYYLLKIREQFKMDNAALRIGGMIDIDSDLHKEIIHYFPNLIFDEMPAEYEFAENLKKLPPHYFSHLFSLALCV